MPQELIFFVPKHENIREWRNGAAWLEHWYLLKCAANEESNQLDKSVLSDQSLSREDSAQADVNLYQVQMSESRVSNLQLFSKFTITRTV